jgi:glycosyltransferase involved in cell wall biosynthesis
VETASGWFSDRTAAYLASGRPAVVQGTGIADELVGSGGLLPFGSPEEAIARADDLAAHHAEHRRAARSFAVEHLDSDRVLGRLLERIGVSG